MDSVESTMCLNPETALSLQEALVDHRHPSDYQHLSTLTAVMHVTHIVAKCIHIPVLAIRTTYHVANSVWYDLGKLSDDHMDLKFDS